MMAEVCCCAPLWDAANHNRGPLKHQARWQQSRRGGFTPGGRVGNQQSQRSQAQRLWTAGLLESWKLYMDQRVISVFFRDYKWLWNII